LETQMRSPVEECRGEGKAFGKYKSRKQVNGTRKEEEDSSWEKVGIFHKRWTSRL
jgi:hypothetical protein